MCLGIPGRVIELLPGYHGQLALVDVAGAERKVNIGMLEDEDLGAGDWVVIHMGFAVERVDQERAAEAMAGLELVGRAREPRVRRRFDVHGLVQGVGFRPFVYVTAMELALTGAVSNDSGGVIAEVEGSPAAVDAFAERLRSHSPPLAIVESVEVTDVPTTGGTGFVIEESSRAEGRRTLASPDVATCDDCLYELADPADRRFRHPFITCTNCGPRFTIICDLPYDRPATTMADFEMCERCRREYDDPRDRRFHAQPIACPDCGPRLELVDADGRVTGDADCLALARYQLSTGAILAVKGIGGYHLVCDAENDEAVTELRRRKHRGRKPFAIMVADLATARRTVVMSLAEERLLADPRRPIVLLQRLPTAGAPTGDIRVADSVAPDTHELGVMLPSSALHMLLLGLSGDSPTARVLVMTSGNRGGEPIATDDDDAMARLAPLVDGWLRHDRRIQVPCDDSVARVVMGEELPIRRSRGYAPMPVALPFDVPATLAVGADLKNTCAVAEGRHLWLSQHIGDMDDLATVQAFGVAEAHLEMLTGVIPLTIVADDHPGYRSARWAVDHSQGREVVTVQHHHAHIAAVMGEHGLDGTSPVIGLAFDGTGYGIDKAIWGGEVLIADYSGFQRFAHLSYVPLAGGDASVERPYRMALSHLRAAGIEWSDDLAPVQACPADERAALAYQLETGFGCVRTSSMGRLFDAVASLTGVRHVVAYEAEAAMALETEADQASGAGDYQYALHSDAGSAVLVSPGPVLAAIVRDLLAGVPVGMISSRFHSATADVAVALAVRARDTVTEGPRLSTVALGGGVFQNARLLRETATGLRAKGFRVLVPTRVPANDGGIALGQVLVASARPRAVP